jgi:hypothetical protein
MTAAPSTERVFALSCFEGVRLIRLYAAKQPTCPLPELIPIIEHVEPDALNLDLEASLYLHGLVDGACPLDGDGFYQGCISSVVAKHPPNWCKAMKQGRLRFLDSLAQNERDVFAAAGIAKDPPLLSAVLWWDTVVGFARLVTDMEKMEQARKAELLTLDHESKRLTSLSIDKVPEWKGLDDNFAGYDVLSYDLGEVGPVNRMIEVKSTVSSPLRFVLTRNEWNQALKFGPAYHFHIWDMAKSPPVLYERTSVQVATHIPTDNEKGVWKTVDIPLGI